ncbi:MAG: adenylate/guanylate cyclase domain-containing protein [Ginsengibacter sp.]
MKIFALFLWLMVPQFYCYCQKTGQEKIDSLFELLVAAKEDSAKVNILNALSLEYWYRSDDTALNFANKALTLATQLNYEMGIADSKQRISMQLDFKGKSEAGIKSGNEALVLYNELLQSGIASNKNNLLNKIAFTYNAISNNMFRQGNYTEGLKRILLGLKIWEQLGEKQSVADAEFNVGNFYFTQLNYPEALKHYSQSLKLGRELGNKSSMSASYDAIGLIHAEQGNYTVALNNYATALTMAQEAKDEFAMAEIYINVAEVKRKLKDYNESLKYNFEALNIYEKVGNNFQIPFIFNNIGAVFMRQKKYKDASEFLNKALLSSKQSGHLEYLKLSYENWASFDSVQGNFKKSLENYKTYIVYRDSLNNKENTRKLTQTQMQYDFDKQQDSIRLVQEKKDALGLEELQKQKLVRNGFIGGFGVVVIFAGLFLSQRNKIKKGKMRSDELLLNILPAEIAEELKTTGATTAKDFSEVTVLFTDFKNFTSMSEKLSAQELVNEINYCYSAFDSITTSHGIEKIKTIGDSYMCAGGLPVANKTNAEDTISAAIEIRNFMVNEKQKHDAEGRPFFEMRIGCNTGPVVAGIVGIKKFAYDIWGDTVNIASRMESSGEAGKVNISGSTYELIKNKFRCTYRGKIQAKNKGEIDMYFVENNS